MSLNWKESDDWRARYFHRVPRRLPSGYESHTLRSVREAVAREEQRAAVMRQAVAAHQQTLLEREAVEKWRPLVVAFGSRAVETIERRANPGFRLPETLREIAAPAAPEEDE